MKAFRLKLNGQSMGDFGVADVGNSTAHINILRIKLSDDFDYRLSVSGLSEPDQEDLCWFYTWDFPVIHEGARIEIEIVDSADCVKPARRYQSDHQSSGYTEEEQRQMRFELYQELKEEFDGA